MTHALFYELLVGQQFEFRGKTYHKTALSFAVDERGWGNVFMRDIEVEVLDGTPLRHGPSAPERPWYTFLTPSPITLKAS